MVKLFVILGVLASSQYVRSESNCDDNSKLEYEVGKAYVYNLEQVSYGGRKHEWDAVVSRNGHYPIDTNGKITTSGKVILTALEKCKFALTLQSVYSQLQGVRVTKEQYEGHTEGRSLPRTSMLFTYRNGEVSDVYKNEGESAVWTENLIRGILTMIQNKAMSNAEGEQEEKETNIRGHCLSRVFMPSEGLYSKTIPHHKCSESIITPSQGIPYNSPRFPVQAPMLHSRTFMKCENNVTNNVLVSSKCSDMNEIGPIHLFRIEQEITTSLILEHAHKEITEVGGATTEEIASLSQSTSIVYDASPNKPDESWADNANEGVTKLVQAMYENLDSNKAELFLKLRESLAFVNNFEALEEKLNNASSEDTHQYLFMRNLVRDVAAEIGTESAIQYIANLIHEKELGKLTTELFYIKLHLAKDATLEGIKALDVLVQDSFDEFFNASILETINVFDTHYKKKVYRLQLIGVSAYMYQFCRQNPNCGSLPEYQELAFKIAQFSTSKQPDLAPAALQAVGNLKHLPESVVKIVYGILEEGVSVPGTTARMLAAFDAFRRDPCQPSLKKISRTILNDKEYVRSFRLTAYLSLTRCFDQEDLKAVQEIFNSEPESYLSSFIASHYNNIMDSQSPSKTLQNMEFFAQVNVPNNVPSVHNKTFATKFVEYSSYNPEYNVGFSIEAAMFFPEKVGESSQSLYPDMVNVNLTLDIFGKSYNKLQVGLSRELIPTLDQNKIATTMELLSVDGDAAWVNIYPYFGAADSYYRVFGTTICMGADLMNMFQAHKFMDKSEDSETGATRLDFVQAFTLLDHEVKMPTISGLPLTFTAQMGYFPFVTANHTGSMNSEGFSDLVSKWDEFVGGIFAHNRTLDTSVAAKVDFSIGKGTPLHIGSRAVAKLRFNHSIGFESVKQENGWIKTINFPEMVVAGARVTVLPELYMKLNGNEIKNWMMMAGSAKLKPDILFKVQGMGLQASAQIIRPLPNSAFPFDAIFKIEKTEEEFKGYGLAIEMEDEGETSRKVDWRAMAVGLSTEDTIHVSFNYTDINVLDFTNFDERPYLKFNLRAEFSQTDLQPYGFDFQYFSNGYPKSTLSENFRLSEIDAAGVFFTPTFGMITRPEYSLQLSSIANGKIEELFDFSINNNKTDGSMSMKFSGPLESRLGNVNVIVELDPEGPKTRLGLKHPFHFLVDKELKTKIIQKSEDLGINRFEFDYSFDSGEIYLNTTTELMGITHEVSHHVLPSSHLEKSEDGVPKVKAHKVIYTADYKDTQNKVASINAEFNKVKNYLENNQLDEHKNITVQITSTDMKEPLFFEGTFQHEWDLDHDIIWHSLKRKTGNLYLNAFGKKQSELTWDEKYTDTGIDSVDEECPLGRAVYRPKDGKNYRCSTTKFTVGLVVADHVEYISTFSNERRIGLTQTIRAYLERTKAKFNMTYDLDYPTERKAFGLEDKLVAFLENQDKSGWELLSESNTDLENRTHEFSTTLNERKRDGSSSLLTKATGKATLAESFFNGESTFKFHHECGRKAEEMDVDIAYKSSTSGHWDTGRFENNLTVLLAHQDRTKMLHPKQLFTWIYSSDGHVTDKQKEVYDFHRKIESDIKFEILTTPTPQEKFHYTNKYEFVKLHNKEAWAVENGFYSVFVTGKEVTSGTYSLLLEIISGKQNQKHIEEVDKSQNALESSKTPMKIKLDYNINGWFEQELPTKQNTTFVHGYALLLIPSERKISRNSYFRLFKHDMSNGKETFSLKLDGEKDAYCQDLLHFYSLEKVRVDVDNKTFTFVKDIRVDGPQISVYIKNEDGSKTGSWLVDFKAGVNEEKHQHKFHIRSKSGSLAQLQRVRDYTAQPNTLEHQHHHHHVGFHNYVGYSLIPYTNFNITVSR